MMNNTPTMSRKITTYTLVLISSLFTLTEVAGQDRRMFYEWQLDKPFRSRAVGALVVTPFDYGQLRPTFDNSTHTAQIVIDSSGKVIQVTWEPHLPPHKGIEQFDSSLFRSRQPKPKVFGNSVNAVITAKLFLTKDSTVARLITSGKDPSSGLTIPMPNDLLDVDEEARPSNLEQIKQKMKIPDGIREKGIQGEVRFIFLVDASGKQVVRMPSGNYNLQLAKAFDRFLDEMEFTPAIKSGKPVWSWVKVPFAFKLL
jgi:hypothetical protein